MQCPGRHGSRSNSSRGRACGKSPQMSPSGPRPSLPQSRRCRGTPEADVVIIVSAAVQLASHLKRATRSSPWKSRGERCAPPR
eukprot:scaffold8335_cov277-Pinguiococcus_pyrenoidosus.AAC.1